MLSLVLNLSFFTSNTYTRGLLCFEYVLLSVCLLTYLKSLKIILQISPLKPVIMGRIRFAVRWQFYLLCVDGSFICSVLMASLWLEMKNSNKRAVTFKFCDFCVFIDFVSWIDPPLSFFLYKIPKSKEFKRNCRIIFIQKVHNFNINRRLWDLCWKM